MNKCHAYHPYAAGNKTRPRATIPKITANNVADAPEQLALSMVRIETKHTEHMVHINI